MPCGFLGQLTVLLKDVDFERLAAGVRALAAGETLIRPAVTERVLRALDDIAPEFEACAPVEPCLAANS